MVKRFNVKGHHHDQQQHQESRGVRNESGWESETSLRSNSFPLLFKGDIISIIYEHQQPVHKSVWLIPPMSSVHSSSSFPFFFPLFSFSPLSFTAWELSVCLCVCMCVWDCRPQQLVRILVKVLASTATYTCTNPKVLKNLKVWPVTFAVH